MTAYGGVDVYIHIFLTTALARGEWSDSRPARSTPRGKSPRYPLDREVGWTSEPVWTIWRKFLNLPGFELRPISRPARSQSLYRLCYPGSITKQWHFLTTHIGKLHKSSRCKVVLLNRSTLYSSSGNWKNGKNQQKSLKC
jgi:hypothetical protein